MTNTFSYFMGIDVSKDKIDIWSTEKSTHLTAVNSKKKIREALYHFDREHTLVVLENTGGYENVCMDTLQKIGYKIHRANNKKVKKFLEYQGINAKTDRVDAKGLATYGEITYNNPSKGNRIDLCDKVSETEKKVRQLVFFSDNIKRIRAAMKNRIKSPNCKTVENIAQNITDFLTEQLKELERVIDSEIEDTEMADKCQLLTQYKGVGKTSALQLVAFLPELGKISNKNLASLCGVAPHPHDSGRKQGQRTTKHACRNNIRKILFLMALSAIRYNKNMINFYEKKLKEGKRKMVAITACMRKMLVQLNAISRKGVIDF